GSWYDAWPSEGSHAELAPRNELEFEFINYFKKKHNISHVSVERIVSGSGLVNVYEFLAQKYPERVDTTIHEAINAAGDLKGKFIAEGALVPGSLCCLVMDTWATHYGAEAGLTCLKYLPMGGLFLAGGMTPKNMSYIE
ncbi:unnamed protein product, partial [Choristocarpus tenellus]